LRLIAKAVVLMVALAGDMRMAAAEPVDSSRGDPSRGSASEAFLLGPPKGAGTVVVDTRFELQDINDVDD
jgi:hypothetical protein